jgi:hypothetical protein
MNAAMVSKDVISFFKKIYTWAQGAPQAGQPGIQAAIA